MERSRSMRFPRWAFALVAVGGLVASGIYWGMMRVQGVATTHLVRALAFGVLGLVMFWGALRTHH